MAVSTTATFDMQRDQIISQAASLARQLHDGHTADADQIAFGARALQLIILDLQKEGLIVRAVERVSKAVAANDTGFTADADTVDVGPVANLRDSSNVDSEATRISRDDYFRRSSKTTIARPLEFYVEKTSAGTVTVNFPVKSDAAYTFIYQKYRKLRDTDTGNVTLDLEPKWLKTITYLLAHEFAVKAGMLNHAAYLMKVVNPDKDKAMLDETERGRIRFCVGDY